jgi:hypothetical protein
MSKQDVMYQYQPASDHRKAHYTLRWRILSIAVVGTVGFILSAPTCIK